MVMVKWFTDHTCSRLKEEMADNSLNVISNIDDQTDCNKQGTF